MERHPLVMRRRVSELVTELRRRRVFRVVLVYAGVAFLIWQVADIAFPALGIPDWAVALVVVLSALGLPLAVVLAWAFDVTPDGVVRTETISRPSAEPTEDTKARWARVQDVFGQMLEIDGSRREEELVRIAEDPAVREEVRDLLRAHEETGAVDRLAASLRDAASEPSMEFPEVGTQVLHYTLLKRLGAGGMGVVYQAEDERLNRMVALKFLAPAFGADPTAKQRFLAEARAAAALDHPNICTILEIGEVADQLFIAMPYYKGRTVKQLLSDGALSAAAAVSIATQVGQGLAAAHASGIVHRDVKPANVIVTSSGAATIVDFGVAKIAHQSLTRTGMAVGTVSYMSPEQARGEGVDHRSDIWSLGVLLYEMVAGIRPFRGPTEQAIQASILTSTPGSLAAYLDGADGLDHVADRALQKDPAHRYATAAEMVQALEQVQLGSPLPGGVGDLHSHRGGLMRSGERRQVTVLTTILGEYDDLVDQLPPESVETILQQVRQSVGDAVTSEGGVVHAVSADRIESVFGIPKVHEDDANRAIRAALEAHRRSVRIWTAPAGTGLELTIRSGIDLGIVAVHRDPDEEHRYRIGRSLMERAGRLAREAAPGDVLLSADCQRLVRSFVETEKGPDVALGQDSGTVATFRAVELREFRSSLEARAAGGLTVFTGRGAEIEVLTEGLNAARSGSGQIVTVSGEAGIGKSRLLYELERGALLSGPMRVLRGRCQSYGASVPYLPFLEVLRELLAVGEGEKSTPDALLVQLRDLGEGLVNYAPFYFHLLSVPSDTPLPSHLVGDQLRLAIVESIVAVLTVASSSTPCTLLLEDWHWADEASTAALAQLGELISAFPMLAVVTHRPGYGVSWEGVSNHQSVKLTPLVAGATQQIIGSALRVEDVDEDLASRIHERSQGNPFFIEEMCAALLEQDLITIQGGRAALSSSAHELSLPDSVQAVIRTRLDRMTPGTREVLSAASVVGRDFTSDMVQRALPETSDLSGALERLRGGGLIQQIRVVPEATYRFKHALIQEVTYETLLGHQRKALHQRVGEAMEELEASGDEDRPFERLADHFYRAEVWDKAVDYALGAARRASRLSQIPEALQALQLAERALAPLPEADERRLELLLMKERLCETTGERMQQRTIIEELIPLVEGSGDVALEAEVLVRAGDLEISLRNYDAAEAALLPAVEKAKQAEDSAVHRRALRSLGLLRWHQDRNDDALEILENVLESDRMAGDTEGMILDHHNLGSVYRGRGDIEKALALAEESVRLARESPFRQVYAVHTVALCQRDLGQTDQALATWMRGIKLCEQHHLPLQQSYLMTSLAHLYLRLGRTEDSVTLYEEAVDLTLRVRHAEGVARAVSALAGVLEGLGRPEAALPHWVEAAKWFGRMEERRRQAHAQCRVAAISEALDRKQLALAAWAKAHQLAAEAGATDLEIESLEALGRLTRRHLGAVALALPYYEEALELARRSGDPTREGALLNSLGVVAWESGDYEVARQRYSEAVTCFERSDDAGALGLALNSLGQCLRRLGALEEARRTLERAVEQNRDAANAQLEGYGLAALGDTLLEQREHGLAARAFEDSLDVRRKIGDRIGEGWMLQRLAQTAYDRGQLDRVREFLTGASRIADLLNDKRLQEACAKLRR